jgi:hypothetical protein
MKDPKKTVKAFAISQYPRPGNKLENARLGWSKGEYMGYSLRTERYRYTIWLKDYFRSNKPFNEDLIVATELYDYLKDPNETENMEGKNEYKLIRNDLHNEMVGFLKQQENKVTQ